MGPAQSDRKPSKARSAILRSARRFSDEYAITIQDDVSDPGEHRFVTLGMGIKGRVLAVVYCYSGDNIRIISARPAGRSEREQYEAQR